MSKSKLPTCKALRLKKEGELIKMLKETVLTKAQSSLKLADKQNKNTNLLKKDKVLIARLKTVLAEKRELKKLKVSSKQEK